MEASLKMGVNLMLGLVKVLVTRKEADFDVTSAVEVLVYKILGVV